MDEIMDLLVNHAGNPLLMGDKHTTNVAEASFGDSSYLFRDNDYDIVLTA